MNMFCKKNFIQKNDYMVRWNIFFFFNINLWVPLENIIFTYVSITYLLVFKHNMYNLWKVYLYTTFKYLFIL